MATRSFDMDFSASFSDAAERRSYKLFGTGNNDKNL